VENKPILTAADLDVEQLVGTAANDKPTENVGLSKIAENLQIILKSSETLQQRACETIIKAEPFLIRDDEKVLFPNTINMVQGQTGVHKSRLVEMMCAAILTKEPNPDRHLGFHRFFQRPLRLLYVDTERNQTEQLPLAIQRMKAIAGYQQTDNLADLNVISLIEIERSDRFHTLDAFLAHLRKEAENTPNNAHTIVVLDVVSDCVLDFNRSELSMQLIDMMNRTVNKSDVTFIVILHENHGSEKARGHLGSELYNKCSTVLQIATEQGNSGNSSDLFRVKYLKCRNTKRYEPYYVQYDEATNGLKIASDGIISSVKESRQVKAVTEDVVEKLQEVLADKPILGSILVEMLCEAFSVSDKIIKQRLTNIIDQKRILYVNNQQFHLDKTKQGNAILYQLLPMKTLQTPLADDNK
jgi:AAA domain